MRAIPLIAAAVFCAAAVPATAAEPDFDGFRACVAEAEAATVTSTFHHCTAALAVHCGDERTAADAVACIAAARGAVEARIEDGVAALSAASGDRAEEIRWLLADGRGAGDSSCAMMASRDAAAEVAVGQRAVNASFCELIVSGDVYALLLRLEGNE
ncbi:MAG: hypothetical protein AAGF90_20340 [Pseudomonadota bacterium]